MKSSKLWSAVILIFFLVLVQSVSASDSGNKINGGCVYWANSLGRIDVCPATAYGVSSFEHEYEFECNSSWSGELRCGYIFGSAPLDSSLRVWQEHTVPKWVPNYDNVSSEVSFGNILQINPTELDCEGGNEFNPAKAELVFTNSTNTLILCYQNYTNESGVYTFNYLKTDVTGGHYVNETNPDNNIATRSVLVGTFTEFGGIILTSALSPESTYPGYNFRVYGNAVYNTTFGAGEPTAGARISVTILGEEGQFVTHTDRYGTYSAYLRAPYTPENYTVTVTITDFTFTTTEQTTLRVEPVPPKPDIATYSAEISFNPSKPAVYQLVNITAVVRNVGSLGAGPFNVTISDGETLIKKFHFAGLAAKSSDTVSVLWNATPKGWHTIRIFADSDNNVIGEQTEANNLGQRSIFVYPEKPDLTPTRLSLSDDTPALGQLIQITRDVSNIGGSDTFNPLIILMEDFEISLEERTVPFISGKGGFDVFILNRTFTTGPDRIHIISVEADPNNVISEEDEDNNILIREIYVHGPSIDLKVDRNDLWFSNSNPLNGTNITIYARVHNIGEVDAADFYVQINESGTQLALPRVDFLAAGSSTVVSANWIATPDGSHRIYVTADPFDTLSEFKENNNLAAKDIYVSLPSVEQADLRILSDDIVFSNTNPDPGEQVMIYATVHNIGRGGAPNIVVEFKLDDETTLGTPSIGYLRPGEQATQNVTWTPVAEEIGSHVVKVTADPANFIPEPNKLDNVATRAIIVGRYVDFAVFPEDITFSEKPQVNQTVTMYVNISNHGTLSGNASVNISVNGVVLYTEYISISGLNWSVISVPFTGTEPEHTIGVEIFNVKPGDFTLGNNKAEKYIKVNFPPDVDFSAIDPTAIDEDTSILINLNDYVYDIDNTDAEMVWSCFTSEPKVLAQVDNTAKKLNLSATGNFFGTALVTCTAADPGGIFDTDTFTLNFTPVNDAPVLLPIGDQVALQNITFTLVLSATDIDSPDLNFSANTTLFEVVKLSATQAIVSFTPSFEQRGNHSIRFTVTDGEFTDYEDIRFLIRGFRIDLKIEGKDDQITRSGDANTTIMYNLSVENLGNTADIITLSTALNPEGWTARFLDETETEISTITVDSLATRYPFFEVDIPETASPEKPNDVLVIATSENGVVTDSVLISTSVSGVPSVEIIELSTDQVAYRLTESATATVRVKNTGGVVVFNLVVKTSVLNKTGGLVFSTTDVIDELVTEKQFTYQQINFTGGGTHLLESEVRSSSGFLFDYENRTFNVGLPVIESFTPQSSVYKPSSTERLTVKARNFNDINHTVYVNFTVTDPNSSITYYTSAPVTIAPGLADNIRYDYTDSGIVGIYAADAVLIENDTNIILDTAQTTFVVSEAQISGLVTDKNFYESRETVTITGTVKDRNLQVILNYTIRDSTGAVVIESPNFNVIATPSGTNVPYSFTLPAEPNFGQWTVEARLSMLGVQVQDRTTGFSVTSYDASAVIGTAGGTLVNPAGTMKIIIPRNALASDTLINITHNTAKLGYTVVSGPQTYYGFSYNLFPKGPVFSKPVTIVMTYNDAEIIGNENNLDIGLWKINKWVKQGAVLDTALNTLTLNVTEFRSGAQ